MDRNDLQQLSKDQLIELALRLQRADKNSRASSEPPSTDKKEKRENSRPGGAKLGHESHTLEARAPAPSAATPFGPRHLKAIALQSSGMRWRAVTRASRRSRMSRYAPCSAMLLV
jgi:hypothetical protein